MALAKQEERWQAKKSTVLERNKYMFDNPTLMSDIRFAFPKISKETTIPAHKYVLAVSSPVFFAMFFGDLAEERDTIDITDCDPDIFLRFLRFVYCDEANFEDIDCAIDVWYLADRYDVPSLARECIMFIDGNMDPLSALYVLPHARQLSNQSLPNDQSLTAVCWEVIDYNAETIIDDDDFLKIQHDILKTFVERSSLLIEEMRLFNAVDRWAAKRCEEQNLTVDGTNKRLVLGEDLLKNIRFSLMPPNIFTDVVLPKNILTKDEVIEVFKCLSSDYSEIPRAISVPLYSCRISSDSLYRWTGEPLSEMLTFRASKSILLCGFNFLFDRTATHGSVSLSLWQHDKNIKRLIAKSSAESWNSVHGVEHKVFFNRPIFVEGETCYTIELLGASSKSTNCYVRCRSSGITQKAANPTGPTNLTESTITFKFCGGSFHYEIPENVPYFGLISEILFQDYSFHFRALSSLALEEELADEEEIYEPFEVEY